MTLLRTPHGTKQGPARLFSDIPHYETRFLVKTAFFR